MESFPKLGMRFEQARSKLMKYDSVMQNANLAHSLVEQVRACEGDSAARELNHEFTVTRLDTNNHDTNRVGSSPAYKRNFDTIKWK
jgi:hypothetical protein